MHVAEKSTTNEIRTVTNQMILDQVSSDLYNYLETSRSQSIGLNAIAKRTGVNRRTLYRILSKEATPHYMTVLKLYRVFFNFEYDHEVIAKAPHVVQEYLKRWVPQIDQAKIKMNSSIESEIAGNSVALEIYILSATGPFTRQEIKDRYGQNGLSVLDHLVQKKVLAELTPQNYQMGQLRFTMSPSTLYRVSQGFIDHFGKPEAASQMGLNFIGFYAEGLSVEAYQEWLKIDRDAHYKKIEIANRSSSKGPIRAFTVNAIDTMEYREFNHDED